MIFRKLKPLELESGYKIICDASNWLNERGIRQWITPLPKEIYYAGHESEQNFGLFLEKDFATFSGK